MWRLGAVHLVEILHGTKNEHNLSGGGEVGQDVCQGLVAWQFLKLILQRKMVYFCGKQEIPLTSDNQNCLRTKCC